MAIGERYANEDDEASNGKEIKHWGGGFPLTLQPPRVIFDGCRSKYLDYDRYKQPEIIGTGGQYVDVNHAWT